MPVEAKCPNCGGRAEVNDNMDKINCKHCSFNSSYDEYIEIMKGRAVQIGDEFQSSWNKG